MDELFLMKLGRITGAGRVRKMEPMSHHTTFRIGGPADYFLVPKSGEEIARVRLLCLEEGIPFTLIGNGSNLLVRDKGIRGVVLALCGGMDEVSTEGTRLFAGAGALLSKIAAYSAGAGLSGLEFSGGIPGTLGGAVFMNAGAYGGEMKQRLTQVRVLKPDGTETVVPAEQMEMGYRKSRIQSTGEIVLSACFELEPCSPAEVREKIREYNDRRREKQPLEFGSAGSMFKRPEGFFAGRLIEECGLSGRSVGEAQVSEKHCGFVINRGGASAAQVLELIAQIQECVRKERGVLLEPEVRVLGEA